MKTYDKVKKTRDIKLLIRAQEIVAEGWTRDALAKDSRGREVAINSPNACKFCAIGAIRRAGYELKVNGTSGAERRLQDVLSSTGFISIPFVNDERSTKQENIYDAFTLAILGAP